MLKGGTAKAAQPKLGAPERVRLPPSLSHASNATSTSISSSMGMKTSRSSSTIASDLRLSRLKRASSDDALAKPALGAVAAASRMKKTVTTGAISELADNRPRGLAATVSLHRPCSILQDSLYHQTSERKELP